MLKKKLIITVLAFGLTGGTLLAGGWEQAQAQQISADQVSNLALPVNSMAGSLRVQGDAEAVQLDVRHKTIGYVLSALAADFNILYQSSSALNEEVNGRYAGSLGRVLSRVLDGYDYVIKRENSKLNVIIFDRSGGLAVVIPSPNPVSENRALIRASRQ